MVLPPPYIDFGIITSGRYDPALCSLPESHGSSIYLLAFHHDRLIEAAKALEFQDAAKYLASEASDGAKLQERLEEHFREAYGTDSPDQALKFRILLPPNPSLAHGALQDSNTVSRRFKPEITSSPVPSLPSASFFPSTLYTPDTLPTELKRWRLFCLPHTVSLPIHPAAAHKTTARAVYDDARAELAALLCPGGDLPLDIEVLLPVPSASSSLSTGDATGDATETGSENREHGSDAETRGDAEISEASRSTPYFFRDGQWVTPRAAAGGCRGTARRLALASGVVAEARVPSAALRVGEPLWLSNAVRGFGWGVLEAWPDVADRRED